MRSLSQKTASGTLLVPAVIIVLACLAVYFNALFNDFVYDDKFQVIENRWIKDIRYVPDIFSTDVWKFSGEAEATSNYYRPMMHVGYMLAYLIFGLEAWGFHLVNILFHAGASILVFVITARLLGEEGKRDEASSGQHSFRSILSTFLSSPPFIAALLFAVHPVHTEAVTWVAGFPEVCFTFFFLLSLYLYIVASTEDGRRSTGVYVLSAASFFVAVLSKETALTLPIVLIAYDYIFRKKSFNYPGLMKRYVLYFIVVCLYFVMRFNAIRGFLPLKRHAELSAFQLVVNVFTLFVQYLEKLLLPVNLNVFHVFHPVASLLEARGVLALLITAAFVVLTLITLKKNKMVCFSLLIIAVPLLPVLYIPALGENTFAERYLYLPTFGFVLLLTLLLSRTRVNMPRGFMGLMGIFIMLVALYSIGTVSRNAVWKDNYTLFADTVRKSPDDAMPRIDLGQALLESGRMDEALEQYRIAIKLNPNSAKAHNNLGVAFLRKGWIDQAIEEFQIALSIFPARAESRYNLGLAFSKKGWIDQAIEQYQIALKLNPNDTGGHINLGNVFLRKGWIDQAIRQYQIALKLDPNDAALRYNMGLALSKKGLADQAIKQYQIALSINPYNDEARYNLGNAFSGKGLVDEAIEQYRIALSINPYAADIYYGLGQAYSKKGLIDGAIKSLEIAVRLNPANPEFRTSLAEAYKMREEKIPAARKP